MSPCAKSIEKEKVEIAQNNQDEAEAKNIDPAYTNTAGDNMTFFAWDGPEDPDEEIQEFGVKKSEFETQFGIKYSKNGIIEFIKNTLSAESPNAEDSNQAKLWEIKLDLPGKLKIYLKKGGSSFNADQPFIRTESTFNQKFKMEKSLSRRGS